MLVSHCIVDGAPSLQVTAITSISDDSYTVLM